MRIQGMERRLRTHCVKRDRLRIGLIGGATMHGFVHVVAEGVFELHDSGPSVSRSFSAGDIRRIELVAPVLPPPKPKPRPVRRPEWMKSRSR